MENIEQFYFDDGENSGEAIFNKWAAKHASKFDEDFDAEGGENKLEYTQIYKEFQDLFETEIESKQTLFNLVRTDYKVRRHCGAVLLGP